jgi:acetyl/propionyl-CoA carboxylase alpha subunit
MAIYRRFAPTSQLETGMKKVLIANRGEIACRIIRACRSLGLATVAVHPPIEAEAMHVSMADEAVAIEAAKPVASYLDVNAIIAAAKARGADAVHPGYGFLSENAEFARAVEAAGLIFVGPRPESIAAMGDKARARAIAESAGVPVLPGSARFEPGALDGLEAAGEAVGFPLLVKASGGGGGIGMRIVDAPDGLRAVAETTQGMAQRSFGDGAIFLERYIRNARHVEVQVFGFGDGEAVHFFERECSLQRRFQKIIEESPSPGISPATRAAMTQAAVALAKSATYRGAGTVEFVVDADTEHFYFLEMNTRIQVEHPITEAVTGADLVALQLRLAAGELASADLPQSGISQRGHAIELRLYAENPARMFLPSPGLLATLAFPAMEGLRVDTGVREGDRITPHFDPMIAKLIVHGATRSEAIERARRAIAATGVGEFVCNLAFLDRVVAHPVFADGRALTSFVEAYRADLVG